MTIAPAAAPPQMESDLERGRTTLADRVVERITALAAAETGDVLSAKANVRVTGHTAALEVRLGLRYPVPVAATAERVRSHLMSRVEELTGLSVSRVDIAVTALETDVKPHRRVR